MPLVGLEPISLVAVAVTYDFYPDTLTVPRGNSRVRQKASASPTEGASGRLAW